MYNILYVGTRSDGYYIEEVCKSNKWNVDFFDVNTADITKQEIELLQRIKNYNFVVYSTDNYINDPDVIAEAILHIHNTAGAVTPIVEVPTINPANILVAELLNKGIKNLINKGNATMADFKEDFIRNVTGYFDSNGREEVEEAAKEVEKRSAKDISTIGVVGTMRRVGTTTQAVQIAKYLEYKGYSACVIEMNENAYEVYRNQQSGGNYLASFFELGGETWETSYEDKDLGYIKVSGVDMYYKPDKLRDIFEKRYDFYVYDYGAYREKGFNRAAFLKDKFMIFVTAAGAAELNSALTVAENKAYTNAKLLFSFTDASDRADIEDIFNISSDDGHKCFFADYVPNMFNFSNVELFDNMLPLEAKENSEAEAKSKEKKKGLFKRGKK